MGQTYECWDQSHGALLYLPHGAHSEDAIRTRLFEDYIRDNADSWISWSKKEGLPVENVEDLILVTGYTLAKSWAIAAFDVTKSRDGDAATISLEVRVSDNGGSQFVWRNLHGSVEHHHCSSVCFPAYYFVAVILRFRIILTRILNDPRISASLSGASEQNASSLGSVRSMGSMGSV